MSGYDESKTLEENAVDIAQWLLLTRVLAKHPFMLDEEDARQDVAAHALKVLRYYDPEKGGLSTFLASSFNWWWRADIKKRRTLEAEEFPFNPVKTKQDDGGGVTLAGRLEAQPDESLLSGGAEMGAFGNEMLDAYRQEVYELAYAAPNNRARAAQVADNARAVVEAYYGYGLSVTSVRDVVGTSHTTVLKHIRQARTFWRESWTREEEAA